jgi:hypothetical protein
MWRLPAHVRQGHIATKKMERCRTHWRRRRSPPAQCSSSDETGDEEAGRAVIEFERRDGCTRYSRWRNRHGMPGDASADARSVSTARLRQEPSAPFLCTARSKNYRRCRGTERAFVGFGIWACNSPPTLSCSTTCRSMISAVAMVSGRAITEASGRITLDTAAKIARPESISVGWLTHSAPSLDGPRLYRARLRRVACSHARQFFL